MELPLKKEKQVNVYLSGANLERFDLMKRRLYLTNDAEVLRACLKFTVENYKLIDILEDLGIDPPRPNEEIQRNLEEIHKKLAESERKT